MATTSVLVPIMIKYGGEWISEVEFQNFIINGVLFDFAFTYDVFVAELSYTDYQSKSLFCIKDDFSEEHLEDEPNPIIMDPLYRDVEEGKPYWEKNTITSFMKHHAIRHRFQFKVKRSSTSRGLKMIDVEWVTEDFVSNKDVTDHRVWIKRYYLQCANEKCQWTFRSSSKKESEVFMVKRFFDVHTCAIADKMFSQRHATSLMIAEMVMASTSHVYVVIDEIQKRSIVCMHEKRCSCLQFQVDGIPCPHAITVLSYTHMNVQSYYAAYYTKENYLKAYEFSVIPLPDESIWHIPTKVLDIIVLPLIWKPRPGDLPACLHSSSSSKIILFSRNYLWNKEQWQHPYLFCQNEALAVSIEPHKKKVEGGNGKVILASSMVGGFVGVTAIIDLAFVVFRKEYTKKKARYLSETRKLGLLGVPPYRMFVLDELREATNNFDISNLIGESSSGQIYKGKLTDGVVVAIRSIKMRMRSKFNSKVNMDTTDVSCNRDSKGNSAPSYWNSTRDILQSIEDNRCLAGSEFPCKD
ncbi:hypothetical protein FXO37_00999 [Capsicum annuum]|nr:hypothetical protein FXO37_00999 [Capsicum annuum]